ncbi:tyrosine-type recombinase/integrase [Piscirickettsia salmonis]|uniref:tyrosine-type recombinase/integrase n=1 Tax=Piscirickettsia salmonis TaxID=1238 RepID=UPI0007C8A5BE|nr:site-specific tyrosine recombinase XerD [Piscirickettsiaceae bacterium NZ-RLO1]
MNNLVKKDASLELLQSLKNLKSFVERNQVAKSTAIAYTKPWQDFEKYCYKLGLTPLPADDGAVALFLYHLYEEKKYKRTTIQKVLAAINAKHMKMSFKSFSDSMQVKAILHAIKRNDNYIPKQAKPLLKNEFERLLSVVDKNTLTGLRDVTLLSWLWFGAFRKSEVVAAKVEDLEWVSGKGVLFNLGRNKVNQTGEKLLQVPMILQPAYPYCPTSLMQRWIQRSHLKSGPIFRAIKKGNYLQNTPLSTAAVDHILSKYLDLSGLTGYTPHSFRAGFLTQAKLDGAPEEKLRQVSQHSSAALERYIRPIELLDNPAAAYII